MHTPLQGKLSCLLASFLSWTRRHKKLSELRGKRAELMQASKNLELARERESPLQKPLSYARFFFAGSTFKIGACLDF